MTKLMLLGTAGLLAAAGIGFAVFTFVLGGTGNPAEAAQHPSVPVNVPGRVGPRITTADRVLNLKSPANDPKYLKMQATIEFETADPLWAWVLGGCKGKQPKPAKHTTYLAPVNPPMVSSDISSLRQSTAEVDAEGAVEPVCVATEKTLVAQFEEELGTGRSVIEDIVTTVVTHHTFDEISSPDGKERLKREIEEAIEEVMPEPRVVRVLFTNFVSQ